MSCNCKYADHHFYYYLLFCFIILLLSMFYCCLDDEIKMCNCSVFIQSKTTTIIILSFIILNYLTPKN